jgi:NNP family nitrate/nitrite transporter-like MFS transporter
MATKSARHKWVILALLCLGVFSSTYAQYQLPPLAAEISVAFRLSTSQFTSLFSAPMIPAVFLSLVAGMLADRFGAKKLIAFGLLIAAVGTFLRPAVGSYAGMMACMIMTGFATTFSSSNVAKILGAWFQPEKVTPAIGIFSASSMIAMTVSTGTTPLFPSAGAAYITAAVIAAAALVLWVVLMKDSPAESRGAEKKGASIVECLKVVVRSKSIWAIGFCLMFLMGSNVAASSLLPSALVSRGMLPVEAGVHSMALTLGSLAGCLLLVRLAWASTRW